MPAFTLNQTSSAGDRLGRSLGGTVGIVRPWQEQLSDGTWVWLLAEFTSTGQTLGLYWSADYKGWARIGTVGTSGVFDAAMTVDAADNIYCFTPHDNHSIQAWVFSKQAGHNWTSVPVQTVTVPSAGSSTMFVRSVPAWANTGGGTGGAGHIVLAVGASSPGLWITAVDAGALLAGTGPAAQSSANLAPAGYAAGFFLGYGAVRPDGFGATAGLWHCSANGDSDQVDGHGPWSVSSTGAVTASRSTAGNFTNGAGATATNSRNRLIRVSSNRWVNMAHANGSAAVTFELNQVSAGAPAAVGSTYGYTPPTGAGQFSARADNPFDVITDPWTVNKLWLIGDGGGGTLVQVPITVDPAAGTFTPGTVTTLDPAFYTGTLVDLQATCQPRNSTKVGYLGYVTNAGVYQATAGVATIPPPYQVMVI